MRLKGVFLKTKQGGNQLKNIAEKFVNFYLLFNIYTVFKPEKSNSIMPIEHSKNDGA